MIKQRLVLIGGYPGGVWSCSWCAAELADGGITHRDDCAWLAEVRAAEQERLRRYIAICRDGLSQEDTYEAGKDMAYLSVLQYLAGTDLLREAQP